MILKQDQIIKNIVSKLNNGQGQDHFSPSQIISKPFAWWVVKYFVSSQEDRRQSPANYKMKCGSLVGNVSQRLIAKYIFRGAEREEIKDRTYNTVFNHELNLIKKENYRNEKDQQSFELMLDYSHHIITQTLKCIKELFGKDAVQCERHVFDQPKDLMLPIVGRIDWESNNLIAEQKSKPPYFRTIKSGLKGYTQKLPEELSLDHLVQLSFYWYCTKKKPVLFYVNDEDYKIFDGFEEEELEDLYETNLVRRAKTIQKLLEVSDADPVVMAELVEPPDLNHYLYDDLTDYQREQIYKLWRI
jgi:hypothetical protein